MSSTASPGESEPGSSGSEQRLLDQVRLGHVSAADALFARLTPYLRRWARGRLPRWARSGVDTLDVVQDALHHTFAQLSSFESDRVSVLRLYLRRAVENRIRDELRRARRQQSAIAPETPVSASDEGAPHLHQLVDAESWQRYLEGLKRLRAGDRRLIVGRVELGYNYEQLALVEQLPSVDAARMALRRAVLRLVKAMPAP